MSTQVANGTLQNGEQLRPISLKERIEIIDVIRGIAIFGILLINIKAFSFPENFHIFSKEMFPDLLNRGIEWFLLIFIEGKFYSMFSFLFGLGMAVQFTRAAKKNRKFASYFSRRMLVLLGIALIHDIFFWNGMILICYATLGFTLIPFKNREQKTIQRWIIGFVIVPLFLAIGTVSVIGIMKDSSPKAEQKEEQVIESTVKNEQQEEKVVDKEQERQKKYDEQIELFRNSSYLQQLIHRIKHLPTTFGITLGLSWYLLAMFLMGIWVWRKGIFQNINDNIPLLKKSLWISLLAGIFFNGLYIVLRLIFKESPPNMVKVIGFFAKTVFGNIAFCMFYISAITLLLNKMKWNFFLHALAAVGRTALSNYIFQAIVCTTIFYNFGFQLFGFTSPVINMIIVFTVFIIQMLLSIYWTNKFKFGPVEWVWRSLTYGKMQLMKK